MATPKHLMAIARSNNKTADGWVKAATAENPLSLEFNLWAHLAKNESPIMDPRPARATRNAPCNNPVDANAAGYG